MENPPEDHCQQHKNQAGEDDVLLILLRTSHIASPDRNSVVLIVGGPRVLAATEHGCGSLGGELWPLPCVLLFDFHADPSASWHRPVILQAQTSTFRH